MKIQYKVFQLLGLAITLFFSACQKEMNEVLPAGKESAALNFYAATDVMAVAYGGSYDKGITPIFIDKYMEQPDLLNGNGATNYNFPFFYFGISSYTSVQNPLPSKDDGINYVRYEAGNHRLYFTDINSSIVLDTTLAFKANTYTTLYLADMSAVNGSAAKYRMILTEEPRQVPEGKIGVRFIHLSPDVGKLSLSRVKDIQASSTELLDELVYGEASGYHYFSPDDQVNGLLRFSLGNPTDGANIVTATPYVAGRSYTVVIQGFAHAQRRQVAVGKNPDGTIKKESITIESNLRADVRRSY